jgi:hypothetical protein
MKWYFFFTVFILFFDGSYAQVKKIPDYSNIITTKKIILKYQDDQADSLMIPVVSDKYPELKKALCDTNLFFGDNLDTIIRRYQREKRGHIFFSYNVSFVNKDVISLKTYYEMTGDDADGAQQWLTLNIHTGKPYSIDKEISPDGLKWLYASYKELLKKRISDDEIKIDKQKIKENYTDIYNGLMQAADTLSSNQLLKTYVFTDKGIWFTTENILSDEVKNFEPEREWFVKYDKLRPYILTSAIVLK